MIYAIFDANLLYIDDNDQLFGEYKLRNVVRNLIEHFPNGDVKVCITESVIYELTEQLIEAYNEKKKALEELIVQFYGIYKLDCLDNISSYEERAKRLVESCFEDKGIEIIPLCGDDYFSTIVGDAIKKRAPFEGKNKKSDKGFKDVVEWYSIVEYAKEHKGRYVLFSNDSIFTTNSKELSHRFKNTTGKTIIFNRGENPIKTIDDMITCGSKEKVNIITKNREWVQKYNVEGRIIDENNFFQYVIVEPDDSKNYSLINDTLKSYVEEQINLCRNNTEEVFWKQIDLFHQSLFYNVLTCKVLYNEAGILCIEYKYDYHPVGVRKGYKGMNALCFNLKDGHQMELGDVIDYTLEELKTILSKYLSNHIHDIITYDKRYIFEKYTSINDFKFFVSEDGVFVYFDTYEIGPRSSGVIKVMIRKRNEKE